VISRDFVNNFFNQFSNTMKKPLVLNSNLKISYIISIGVE
jgi:hypothetical protein